MKIKKKEYGDLHDLSRLVCYIPCGYTYSLPPSPVTMLPLANYLGLQWKMIRKHHKHLSSLFNGCYREICNKRANISFSENEQCTFNMVFDAPGQ